MSPNLENVAAQVVAGTAALKRGEFSLAIGHLVRSATLLGMCSGEDWKDYAEASLLSANLQWAISEAIEPSGKSWDERNAPREDDRQLAERGR